MLVGIFVGCGVYLMLSRNVIRVMFGLGLLSIAVNLALFAAGRLPRGKPPLLPADGSVPLETLANPVPQALLLTAIVISFGLMSFVLVLAYRGYQELGVVDTDAMRFAEPPPDAGEEDDASHDERGTG